MTDKDNDIPVLSSKAFIIVIRELLFSNTLELDCCENCSDNDSFEW